MRDAKRIAVDSVELNSHGENLAHFDTIILG